MNDPGLDDPIANAGGEVDGKTTTRNDPHVVEEEEEKNFLLPSRWWIASTAIPLIAGTFGPMANAFSICALVENWRVSIPPGGSEEHGINIADPKWLIAVNAVSLVAALIANIALLLNMARRLRFTIAQPITILGFYLASFLLIGLVSVAGGGHLHAKGVHHQALNQAYYYGIFAAGLYLIISSLLVITAWGAWKNHYSREFELTISQRTLMLQTISYMVYLLLGALVYCKIEGWTFLDSVYFANFTLLTVGIGDYSPTTHAGRSLIFPYALGGIVILGLVIGSIRSLVLDRGKQKMAARNLEKTRRAVLRRLDDKKKAPRYRKWFSRTLREREADLTLTPAKDGQMELRRREAEFLIMREVQSMSSVEGKWISLLLSSISAFSLWFIGAVVFWKSEGSQEWSYFEALYFTYTSLLTIGYGDLVPMSNAGKPFFVFWSLLAVPTLTVLISDMGDTVVKSVKDITLIAGELTVLPGEKGSARDRLKVALSKITGGRYDVGPAAAKAGKRYDDRQQEMERDDAGIQERAPGMPREPKRPGEGETHDGDHERDAHGAMLDRITGDMEKVEVEEETEAHDRGDEAEEDEHHYRYLLIKAIREVYTHIGAEPAKKYSYQDWCRFLELLGEDESSTRSHRKAPINVPETGQGVSELEGAVPVDEMTANEGKQEESRNWSWIGNRSPLMGGKDEAEWLLERLASKLEVELSEASRRSRRERQQGQRGATRDSGSTGTL